MQPDACSTDGRWVSRRPQVIFALRLAGALTVALGVGTGAAFALAQPLVEAAGATVRPSDQVRAGALIAAMVSFLAAMPAFLLLGGRMLLEVHRRGTADARVDALTGLPGERELADELTRMASLAARGGRSLACAVFDVDDCKLINETRGHDGGDAVLRAVGETLVAEARMGDRCFRLDGDAFAVLLADTDLIGAVTAAERIVARFTHANVGATVSVGVAAGGPGRPPSGALAAEARSALGEGRMRGEVIATAPQAGDPRSATGPDGRRALQELLTAGSIGVVFQPIVDLTSGVTIAFEALARPLGGEPFPGPTEAFHAAEDLGRGHELDALCRRAALAASRSVPGWALLFLNVSPQSFQRRTLVPEALVDAVHRAGRDPESVVLEITERSVADLDIVVETAHKLRDAGFRIALDDTGAGNAGLQLLRALPLDFVKVDRMVIAQARSSRSAMAVLAAIMAFAEHRGVDVIIEGIEDAETLAFVRAEVPGRVRALQGFHFGQPSSTPALVSRTILA